MHVPRMSWKASSPNSQPLDTAAVEARPGSRPSAFTESEFLLLGIDRDRKTNAPRALLAKAERGQFVYAGPAFIALRSGAREEFRTRLAELKQERPVLSWLRNRDAHWVRPELTLKVKHLAGARLLRHATVKELVQ
jgi:bifunctional non-homologous end joining protein LigD